ncbi:hypothetical protein J3R82DRAFT_5230 [Butyriboletus roseoflavus]|nr:hypothetical protein J3R82DRAFT_5230 [Butyriboletus roseoflavus]
MPITINHTMFSLQSHLLEKQLTTLLYVTFNVKHQEEVVLIPYNLIIADDNQMQAEEYSHGGLKCNYFCCTCKVGGTNIEKKADQGYSDIFQIKHQINLFKILGGTGKIKNALSKSGIHDQATAAIMGQLLELDKVLQKGAARKAALSDTNITVHLDNQLNALLGGHPLDGHINPLLRIQGLDIHKDTNGNSSYNSS